MAMIEPQDGWSGGVPRPRKLSAASAMMTRPTSTVAITASGPKVEVGLVIIAEAALSFLGLGTPPDQPSWGSIIANGRAYLNTAWWISTMPGLALSLVVLSVGLFGDRLRDYLDPRSVARG